MPKAALPSGWQRQALAAAVFSSAEHDEIKRLRTAPQRAEMERDIFKKVVTVFS